MAGEAVNAEAAFKARRFSVFRFLFKKAPSGD
jgi:hypothetical protein